MRYKVHGANGKGNQYRFYLNYTRSKETEEFEEGGGCKKINSKSLLTIIGLINFDARVKNLEEKVDKEDKLI